MQPGSTRPTRLGLLLLLVALPPGRARSQILVAAHRRDYDDRPHEKLRPGKEAARAFQLGRFKRPSNVKAAFELCRSPNAFKRHEASDGRIGSVCSTKLGGDWVLAESEQVAPSCTCEEVLLAYLDSALGKRWNAAKIADQRFTRKPERGVGRRGGDSYYQQDIKLLSQRVIRSHTGPMSYSQRVTIDQIGARHFCCHVRIDHEQSSSARKPFENLQVFVGLQQVGDDVHIYAAGLFEVNRRVVPNLIVFDASGIAGDIAGKDTLWLSGHFGEVARRRAAEQRERGRRWRARLGWPPRGGGGRGRSLEEA